MAPSTPALLKRKSTPPKAFTAAADIASDLGVLAHIGRRRQTEGACLLHEIHRAGQVGRWQVDGHHRRPLPGEADSGGPAYASCRPRHDHNLVLEASRHGRTVTLSWVACSTDESCVGIRIRI